MALRPAPSGGAAGPAAATGGTPLRDAVCVVEVAAELLAALARGAHRAGCSPAVGTAHGRDNAAARRGALSTWLAGTVDNGFAARGAAAGGGFHTDAALAKLTIALALPVAPPGAPPTRPPPPLTVVLERDGGGGGGGAPCSKRRSQGCRSSARRPRRRRPGAPPRSSQRRPSAMQAPVLTLA